MSNKTKFCQHCLPQEVSWHLGSRLSYYSDKIKNLIYRPKVIFPKKFTDSIWSAFISTFKLFGIVSFESNINESEFQNRHLIFFREAGFRGIQIYAIKFFGKYTSDFMYYWRGKKYFYEGNPICNSVNNSKFDIDDKYLVKKLLKSHDLPTAEGRFFVSKAKAIKYAEKIGFPLVVKPCSGSLSKHVTTNINSLAELDEAITVAKQYRKDFIIEKYIEGRLYRATVVGKKHVFVCEKDAPNVVGDGISTVEELVNKKNLLENRSNERNVTLHKISINNIFLESSCHSTSFVPKKYQKVYVNNKATLSLGCDVINCSEIIHPFNKKNVYRSRCTIRQ